MATAKATESDLDLREELETLRNQVSEIFSELQRKGKDTSVRLADKLESEVAGYQKKAGQEMRDAVDAGSAGLNKVTDQVRDSPVASLLVAFGVGYALSRLMGSDKQSNHK